jgi:glycosyltransferase involved in cell wall biosynthesis
MKVAVVVGVAVTHDAISSAAIGQVATLQASPDVDEVHLFTQGIDRESGCPVHLLGSPWELLRHDEFRSCDVAIFHWGIYFALFDALTLMGTRELPAPVVHFHNCTPPSLVEEPERTNLLRSIEQFHHVIGMGVPIWTYSEFNRRTLIDWGALDGQIGWVTFPITTPGLRIEPRHDGRANLLSVGRMVPAKGLHVLIDALDRLPDAVLASLRVRVVSSTTFSSEDYRATLEAQVAASRPALADAIQFIVSPAEAVLMELYSDSDVVVSTSFHEGLCVPVIEGYAAGCRAIGTTAGNLPYLVIAPDPVVAPGDSDALADAIERVVRDLVVDDAAYHERRRALVESFTPRTAAELTQRALAGVLDRTVA